MHITEQSNYIVTWIKTIVQKLTKKQNNTKMRNTGVVNRYFEHKSSKNVALKGVGEILKVSKSEGSSLKIT